MIQSNLAYDYVDNIPWDKNPAFAFSDDTEAYLTAFKNVVEKIPIKDSLISFSDDVWDFNSYFNSINHSSYKIIFTNCPPEIVDYAKFFILYRIMGKTKISTANVRYINMLSVINNIINNTLHKSIFVITTDDIINEIESRNASPSTTHNLYESIYQFYYFIINNYKLEVPVDIEKIKKLGIKDKELSKKEYTKLPNIPEEYFNKILNKAISVMRDETEPYNFRATACSIIMLSQLGLRISDLMALTTDQLFSKRLAKSGNIAYYIHYKARKPSKPHDAMLEFDIFSNSLCTEAYNTLKAIRKDCEFSNEAFLYVLNHTAGSTDEYPIANHRFNLEMKKFLYKYLKEDSTKEWEGIKMSNHLCYNKEKKNRYYIKIALPDTRQFRVHLCTTLYEKGIPLVYIQRYMSHLSEYMLGYYVRPKDTYQENIAYSEKVIKEIAGDDITPLGLLGEDIKLNIQKFINDNGFNVKTDINAIMKALGDKVIIRGKTGGVCIKTSLMPCSKDARTNEMMCAYNLCPNLFHFYYMIDVSYLNFVTMQETYEANKANGQIKAAQKELNKIKDVLRRRLVPEMDELDKEIARKGAEPIIEQYPSLRDIIENKDNIRKELDQWMNKN